MPNFNTICKKLPATTSTDLFEGPQYRIALFFCELEVGSCWIFLSIQYTIWTPTTVFPVPVKMHNNKIAEKDYNLQ